MHIALTELAPTLAPAAGPPPRLTPQLWGASCKGGEARCRDCDLCAWQGEVERWSHAAPWSRQHELEHDETAPRWSSLAAALAAVLEYERTGRDVGSALGSILARAERGEKGQMARDPRRVSREVHRAHDIVHVQAALERAYSAGQHGLTPAECVRVLLERVAGALPELTPYGTLTERYGGLGEDALKALVKHGKRAVGDDLVSRGLLPRPRIRARATAGASTWSATDE
jgi:hypothetical protein